MILFHLFQLSGLTFQVAHVNYQLRGISSDKDYELVKKVCDRHNIKLHLYIKKINNYELKKSNLSLQMMARNIRYNFFSSLSNKYSLDIIVTGHHQDDQIETFFIKLFRGSGLKGLSGMKFLQNNIFHPFLNFSKNELLNFGIKEKIAWREDLSNKKNIYLRNKIRNQFIPFLDNFLLSYKKSIYNSMLLIQDAQNILEKTFYEIKKKILKKIDYQSQTYFYDLKEIRILPLTFSYFFFSEFGGISANEINKFIRSSVGTCLSNKKFIFWIDYQYLIIEPVILISFQEFLVTTNNFNFEYPLLLKGQCLTFRDPSAQFWINFDKLIFPLKIRKWKLSDFFYPINMIGSKKISKYLRDQKISQYFKNKTYVLVDNLDRIVLVLGMRLDDRFKVLKTTKKILNIWIK